MSDDEAFAEGGVKHGDASSGSGLGGRLDQDFVGASHLDEIGEVVVFENAVHHVDGLVVRIAGFHNGFPIGKDVAETDAGEKFGIDCGRVERGDRGFALGHDREMLRVLFQHGSPCSDIVCSHADVAFAHEIGGQDLEVSLSESPVSPGFSALSGGGLADATQFGGEDRGAALDEAFDGTVFVCIGLHGTRVQVEDA